MVHLHRRLVMKSGATSTSDENTTSGATSTSDENTGATSGATSTSDENTGATSGATSTSDENTGATSGATSTSDENTGATSGATSTTSDEITNGLVKADLVQLISDLESVSSTLKKINRGFVGHEYTEAFYMLQNFDKILNSVKMVVQAV